MRDDRLRGISCFSGIGGLDLALQEDVRTVCYVEWDGYCQEVLKKRMQEGWLDEAPIWSDICSFSGKEWAGRVDIVFGGFPCQPFSVAGKNEGADDERNMWPETYRIIREVRPAFVFLENVTGLFNHEYIKTIFGQLAEAGYDCRWTTVQAAEVSAPHRRERIFILAYLNPEWRDGVYAGQQDTKRGVASDIDDSKRPRFKQHSRKILSDQESEGCCPDSYVGNSNINSESVGSVNEREVRVEAADYCSQRSEGQRVKEVQRLPDFSWCEDVGRVEDLFNRPYIPEPLVCRTDDGFSSRVDRLKCLGNAVVPLQGRLAWKILRGEL